MGLLREPAARWVGPFAVFLILLALLPRAGLEIRLSLALWIAITGAAILVFSRKILDLRLAAPLASVLVGVAVFAVWILPDLLAPGWRSHWLFQNPLTGSLSSSIASETYHDPIVLGLRSFRAVVIVPLVEELFWRGWLMRWLVRADFESVPLGTYAANAFWVTAALFAMEHGPYWDVGLLAGIIYNYWMVRTRKLGDLILAHAVTNACLSAYVIAIGRWEYWM